MNDIKIYDYDKAKTKIRPLALVMFAGNEIVSTLIRMGEYTEERLRGEQTSRIFSHCGVIVTKNEMPNIKNARDDELYVLESTASGWIASDKVVDVESRKGVLGVQIRNFRHVCSTYNGVIAVANLKDSPIDRKDDETTDQYETRIANIKDCLSRFHTETRHRMYQINIMKLMSALVPMMRKFKWLFTCTNNDWLFCSQLVALFYKSIQVLPDDVNSANVIPMDYLVPDMDGEIPTGLFDNSNMFYIRTLQLEKERDIVQKKLIMREIKEAKTHKQREPVVLQDHSPDSWKKKKNHHKKGHTNVVTKDVHHGASNNIIIHRKHDPSNAPEVSPQVGSRCLGLKKRKRVQNI